MPNLNHPRSRARRREIDKHYNSHRDGFGNIIESKDPFAPNVMNTPYCPACHKEKMIFKTEQEALLFIEYNAERIASQKGYAPIRAYYCKSCGGWHITSKVKREYRYAV